MTSQDASSTSSSADYRSLYRSISEAVLLARTDKTPGLAKLPDGVPFMEYKNAGKVNGYDLFVEIHKNPFETKPPRNKTFYGVAHGDGGVEYYVRDKTFEELRYPDDDAPFGYSWVDGGNGDKFLKPDLPDFNT